MRLQQYLNEEYHSRIRSIANSAEVFTNPSRKEIREISKDDPLETTIKFIADNRNKKIYVWKYTGPVHEDMWEEARKKDLRNDTRRGYLVPGYAGNIGGKWEMTESDGDGYLDETIKEMTNRTTFIKSFKWADKYILITKYLRNRY